MSLKMTLRRNKNKCALYSSIYKSIQSKHLRGQAENSLCVPRTGKGEKGWGGWPWRVVTGKQLWVDGRFWSLSACDCDCHRSSAPYQRDAPNRLWECIEFLQMHTKLYVLVRCSCDVRESLGIKALQLLSDYPRSKWPIYPFNSWLVPVSLHWGHLRKSWYHTKKEEKAWCLLPQLTTESNSRNQGKQTDVFVCWPWNEL